MNKKTIISIIIALGLLLIAIFSSGLYGSPSQKSEPTSQQTDENSKEVKVLSTTPEKLHGSTLLPTQIIEIKFNKVLNNDPADLKIEPETKYNAHVTDSGKTLRIEPLEPYKLGSEYTITIKQGYDLQDGNKLDKDIIFRFRTIEYRGV